MKFLSIKSNNKFRKRKHNEIVTTITGWAIVDSNKYHGFHHQVSTVQVLRYVIVTIYIKAWYILNR